MRRSFDETSFDRPTVSMQQQRPIFVSVARRRTSLRTKAIALAAVLAGFGLLLALLDWTAAGAAFLAVTLILAALAVRRRVG